MANLDLFVENIETHSEEAERGLYEHSKASRRSWENPAIGYRARNIRSEHNIFIEGTSSAGEIMDVKIEIRKVHPEWKKITSKRAKQFFSEMVGLRWHKIPLEKQNGSYIPQYELLRSYFQ